MARKLLIYALFMLAVCLWSRSQEVDGVYHIGAHGCVLVTADAPPQPCQNLPDAPEVQPDCVYKGKPCKAWVRKMIGTYPPVQGDESIHYDLAPAKFLSIHHPKEPYRNPNKRSWAIFTASHVAGWTALAKTDHQVEHWSSEAPAMAGVTVVDFLIFKFLSPALGWEGGAYAAKHYSSVK